MSQLKVTIGFTTRRIVNVLVLLHDLAHYSIRDTPIVKIVTILKPLHSQYILWATDPDRGFCALSEEKKTKNKTSGVRFFFVVRDILRNFDCFGAEKLSVRLKKIHSLLSMSQER